MKTLLETREYLIEAEDNPINICDHRIVVAGIFIDKVKKESRIYYEFLTSWAETYEKLGRKIIKHEKLKV